MVKVLAGVAMALFLTGCINSKEKKMESACKEIVLNHAIDPKEVSFNTIRLLSGEMSKEEFVQDYYGSTLRMNDDERRLLQLMFKKDGEGASKHIVDIDFTDKSKGASQSTRNQAICIYIHHGENVEINSFTIGNSRVGRGEMPIYFITNKLPPELTPSGKLK